MHKTVIKHALYHLTIGLAFFIIFSYITKDHSLKYFVLIIIGSYVLDIDHLAHHYLYRRKHHTAITFRKTRQKKGLAKALVATGHYHKERDRLLLHNLYFLGILIIFFFFVIILRSMTMTALVGAMLAHMVFDILDDIAVLGHLDNWVWKKKSRIF